MAQSIPNKVLQNTETIIAGNLISISIGLVTNIFIVRYLGASNFGIYASIFAYLAFFSVITDLGIGSIIVREAAKDRARAGDMIGNAIVIRLALSVVAILASCIVVSFLRYPLSVKLMIYIASMSFLFSLSSVCRIAFQVNLQMKYPVFADIVSVTCKCAAVLFLVFVKASLVWFIVAEVLANIPSTAILWRMSKRLVHFKVGIDLKLWRFIFIESWPLAISSVFAIIYLRADVLILAFIKGASAVGYYSAVYKFTETLSVLPSAFMISVFPIMSNYFKHSPESLVKSYRMIFKYILTAILPLAVGISLLSPRILPLIYGNKFQPSIPVLSVLIWVQVFFFMNTVLHYMIISIGKQKAGTFNICAMVIVNLGLNFALIPAYSFIGTSAAKVATEALGSILGIAWLAFFGYRLPLFKLILRPLAGAAAVGLFIYYFSKLHLLAIIPAAVLIYILVELLVGAFNREDVALIKSCFGIKKEVVYGER